MVQLLWQILWVYDEYGCRLFQQYVGKMGCVQVSTFTGKQETDTVLTFNRCQKDTEAIRALGEGIFVFNWIVGAV